MVKLKRLKIEKYRNVKPGTELRFRDSLNVMLGRNGTGKTTLLNLIVQILSWDFSKLQTETANLEYEMQASDVELTVRLRTEVIQAPLGGGVDAQPLPHELLTIGLVQRSPQYATTLEIEIVRPQEKPWTLRLEGATLTLSNNGESPYTITPERPLLGTRSLYALIDAVYSSPSQSLRTLLAPLLAASAGSLPFLRRFDESLWYLEHVIERESMLAAKSSQDRYMVMYQYQGPPSFALSVSTALTHSPEGNDVVIDSRDKGQEFLHLLVSLLGFKSAQVRLQRIARSADPHPQLEFGNIQFYFTRRDGSIINHSLLSYGQKRLLAFYYYLATYPTSVVADELVNGMHHEWIEACLEDLGERQAFLTSQNPLLLDYLSFESADEVRTSFVLCRTEFHEGREQLVWENMTEEDAEGFFKGYQVAIQHVSELLRTRGLW